ncbi:WavE lipopolysaccharide synthesis family protein [Pseudomonas protegens]|uniref:WavE lipopolysaccharide synthesis family protein n=2 Tax=Pseudomonas protegens TaxID=380021 RepID=UPI001B333BCD|nr:WavE lipopolysaccharide synthesis family protein [Pseudomonas protegens]MBP5107241.1 WavE lipopolysaccharide synthesis [Pseudomonas protegens]MBP5133488.1 WavE lipopolysaccharide synthesis [Pseudomonas protegens]MBP5150703.1 WavE lipopolysaccharide synthesis [Pseudomonas protegens]
MDQWLTKVDSRDISVVIQGPLYRALAPSRGIDACVAAVRRHLPHAEIVISSWADEVLSGIDADVVITTADPGVLWDFNGNRHNTNRQLASTLTGIRTASRSYILKLRSDHILTGSNIAVMGAYDPRIPLTARLLRQPITVTTLFIRNPVKVPLLFHLSDLVQFGTHEDMLMFWDQELRLQEEVFAPSPYKNPIGNFVGYSAMRMTPEQCLMLGFMRKKGYDISLQKPGDISPELVELSEGLLSENFTVLDWETSQVDFPERFRKTGYSLKTIYKASELATAGNLSPAAKKARYRKIWLNKYVFNFGRVAWWIALASILLTSVSPNIAKSARAAMRKLRGLEHPNNDRV